MLNRISRQFNRATQIRKAIDNHPDGLAFAAPEGRPIMTNQRYNALCRMTCGHTVTNAATMWDALFAHALTVLDEDAFLLEQPSGRYWHFKREQLRMDHQDVVQYTASDITALYLLEKQLSENNRQVAALHERQRNLMENIVQNNLEKELLGAKMRVHDAFGRLLIMTNQVLNNEEAGDDEISGLITDWENIVSDMEHAAMKSTVSSPSPENELVRIASMIGCKVDIRGPRPTEKKVQQLLFAAIREALTNAVRHANATALFVSISLNEADRCYYVTIRDNGKGGAVSVNEGSGLGSLRQRLEQEGAEMHVRCEDGVVLELVLHYRRNKDDYRTDC